MAEKIYIPKSREDARLKCLEQGILLVVDEVNNKMKEDILASLLILRLAGSPNIEIQFSSGGGDSKASFVIYKALKMYSGIKTGIVIDKAHSAAATILQACDLRKISKYSTTNIHYGSRKVNSNIFISENSLEEEKLEAKKLSNILEEILMSRANIELSVLQEILFKNDFLSAEEMVGIGLADEIF